MHSSKSGSEPRAKKSLGQHFLRDESVLQRIVRAAGPLEGRTVLEVGPGPGALTKVLLASDATRILAAEKDDRMIPNLEALAETSGGRLQLVHQDALELHLAQLPSPLTIVANLPYNVATQLLLNWLEQLPRIETMVLMFQKEVAERLVAQTSTKDYGRISVLTQWLCDADMLFNVPPGAFSPPPKVTSSVVRLIPKKKLEMEVAPKALKQVTQAAFGQRRKMLRQSLKSLTPECDALMERAGIDSQRRAETLTVSEFLKLAALWESWTPVPRP